jgi:hypothetical protein
MTPGINGPSLIPQFERRALRCVSGSDRLGRGRGPIVRFGVLTSKNRDRPHAATRHPQSPGSRFRLHRRDDHAGLAEYLDAAFAALRTPGDASQVVTLTTRGLDSGAELTIDNQTPNVVAESAHVLPTLMSAVNRAAVGSTTEQLFVHAVEGDGRAILFPALMEAGESTLAAALLRPRLVAPAAQPATSDSDWVEKFCSEQWHTRRWMSASMRWLPEPSRRRGVPAVRGRATHAGTADGDGAFVARDPRLRVQLSTGSAFPPSAPWLVWSLRTSATAPPRSLPPLDTTAACRIRCGRTGEAPGAPQSRRARTVSHPG